MNDKGAYLISKDKMNIISSPPLLFVYMKLSKLELKKALPLSYDDNKHSEYLGAVFENGMDFVAPHTKESIQNILNERENINLLDNNYETCLKTFPTLKETQYTSQLEFSKTQLNISTLYNN